MGGDLCVPEGRVSRPHASSEGPPRPATLADTRGTAPRRSGPARGLRRAPASPWCPRRSCRRASRSSTCAPPRPCPRPGGGGACVVGVCVSAIGWAREGRAHQGEAWARGRRGCEEPAASRRQPPTTLPRGKAPHARTLPSRRRSAPRSREADRGPQPPAGPPPPPRPPPPPQPPAPPPPAAPTCRQSCA